MEFFGFPVGGAAGEMAGLATAKVKRKDLEEVYDEFSEFSLSSPARKIRRLDAELPPIMEEEEPAAALLFGQPLQEEQPRSSSRQLASLPSNEERAIVLYKPVNAPLLKSPNRSNVFFNVNPDVIASFKSRAFWRDQAKVVNRRDEEAEATTAVSSCLSVVPWMPYELPEAVTAANSSGAEDRLIIEEEEEERRMASEEADGASMDIEVGGGLVGGITPPAGMAGSEGIQHWPQQHCMTPQVGPSPSESSPSLMWSWG